MQLWRFVLVHVCMGLVMTVTVNGEGPTKSTGNRSIDAVLMTAIRSREGIHLGNYRIGREVFVRVHVKNSTGLSLNLRSIDPDCGCLAVVPEQRSLEPDGTLSLALRLASSNKVANVRRSIRLFFQESAFPFVLDVDVRITGPLGLDQTTVRLADPDSKFDISGQIHELGGKIQRVESVRGSFATIGSVVQDSGAFKFIAKPTFSFGDAEDLVRVHYLDPSAQAQIVDLPILLRYTTPVRFLPSTLNLHQRGTRWVGVTRMIVVRGKLKVPLEQLRFVLDAESNPGKLSPRVAVQVRAVSSIMSKVEVVITEGEQHAGHDRVMIQARFPRRLVVRGSRSQVVGILNLVRNGEE
jgi:hypothetical protein